jgi:hypothetical protein
MKFKIWDNILLNMKFWCGIIMVIVNFGKRLTNCDIKNHSIVK